MSRPLFLSLHGQPSLPVFIGFTGTGVDVSATAGTLVGTLSTTGGLAAYTYTCSDSKFQIVGNQVQRSATGTLVVGTPESLNFTSTDAVGHVTDTSTNGQGPYSVAVTSANVPTGVTTSPTNISIPATTAGNTVIATLTEVGGTGVSVVFSVTGNTNLTVVGSNLQTVASPTFVAGVNQTYSLHVTDTGGTYNDASPRTLTVQAASAPTGVQVTVVPPFPTVLANETAGTVLANLVEQGGTGVSTVFSLVAGSSANLAVSGTQLVIHSSPSFTPGTSPTYAMSVTDTGGTFSETAGSRSYTVPAGPTGITHSPDSIEDNAGANTPATTLTPIGGTSPGTWAITTGLTAFNIGASGATSQLTLKSAAVGTLTPGQATSANQGTVTYTDAAGLSTSAVTVNLTIQDHTASSLVTTLTAVNTSTTTDTATNANTIMLGHPFKNGTLTSGTYPIFKMNDGTVVPYSIGQSRSWVGGSLKNAVYMLRLPEAIAHNGSGTGSNVMSIFTNGSAPTASVLSTTDITANTDF